MIRDLVSESVLVATIALVAMPLISRRFRMAFHPVELTRYNSATMSTGLSLLLMALIACAAPVASALLGGSLTDRHFFPGDTIIGWISAIAAITVAASAIIGYRRFRSMEHLLAIEPGLGLNVPRTDYDLVILPTDQALAYAVSNPEPQVVISSGLVRELPVSELVSVIEHEAAHIRLGHRRHLALAAMMEPIAVAIPPARRLVDVSRMALERAADSATTNYGATRAALLRLSGITPNPGVAAFTAGDVMDRLDALAPAADHPKKVVRAILYFSAFALAAASAAVLSAFWI